MLLVRYVSADAKKTIIMIISIEKRQSQIMLSKHLVKKTIRREIKNFEFKNRYFGILLSSGGHGWGILEYTWLEIHGIECTFACRRWS